MVFLWFSYGFPMFQSPPTQLSSSCGAAAARGGGPRHGLVDATDAAGDANGAASNGVMN